MRRPDGNRRSGYSLVEVCISLTVLVIVLGGAFTMMNAGQRNFRRNMSNSLVNNKANRAVNRIARSLAGAGRASLFPTAAAPFGSDNISFREVAGWGPGGAVWSSDFAIRLEYDPAETDNGADDDGDGFVDECQVILLENVGELDERRAVIVKDVREFLEGESPDGLDENANGLEDERGLCFERRGDTVIIRLSVLGRDPEGGAVMQTLETMVGLRN